MRRSTRHLAATSILWPLCCLPGCSGSNSGAGAHAGASAPMNPPASYTVSVSQGRPATLAQEQLTLSLTDVKDSRCPVGVQCVWAGHAAVTLAVGKAGAPPQPVVVGTEAPENLKLPHQATYGPYTLSLTTLEPQPTKDGGVPLPRYVATVQVTRN
jgi:hypothetical protein